MEIRKRAQKLAFYEAVDGNSVVLARMKGFTELSISKNPIEYSRQYIDESYERSDVTGYSPSISFSFDQIDANLVHDDIISIFDKEYVGEDAIRNIIIVDTTSLSNNAVKRSFAVIPDNEGKGSDAYTYSGTFKAVGEKIFGTAKSTDNWATCTFTASS